METVAHARLKRAAIAFLLEHGCCAAATEVRCPRSRYRADAAGYLDTRPLPEGDRAEHPAPTLWHDHGRAPGMKRNIEPRTVIIECKQSRADFLRDAAEADDLLAARERLRTEQRGIEAHLIREYEPQLRRSGEFLFDDLESWDFEKSRLAPYRRVLRELRRLDARLYGETKFFMMARYRVADRLYLLAPRGVVRPRELPECWGLLEARRLPGGGPDELALRVRAEAPPLAARDEVKVRLLRNIAVAATRTARRAGADASPSMSMSDQRLNER